MHLSAICTWFYESCKWPSGMEAFGAVLGTQGVIELNPLQPDLEWLWEAST